MLAGTPTDRGIDFGGGEKKDMASFASVFWRKEEGQSGHGSHFQLFGSSMREVCIGAL